MTSTPEEYRGCPVVHTDYRVDRPIFQTFALLNEERELAPILRNESAGTPFWMVSRYDQVKEVLQTPDIFGNEIITALNPDLGLRLLPQHLNPPEHGEVRKLVNPWFSPSAVRRLEPVAVRRCVEMIEEIAPVGHCDLIEHLAIRFPTEMFLATLNLPVSDGEELLLWVDRLLGDAVTGIDNDEASRAEAWIRRYFTIAVEDRIKEPQDVGIDFISHLLVSTRDGQSLPVDDIVTICLSLLAAGLETTRSALGYIFHHLATHPDVRQLVIDDPEETPRVVEELLRLYPLVFQDGRLVKQDVDFHGCPMKKGDVVWAGFGSANRDPRKFDDPDVFDIDRFNGSHHLSFGAGPHRCLGMHLARHELIVAVNEWHARIPHYSISSQEILMERGGQLMLRSLPLRWEL